MKKSQVVITITDEGDGGDIDVRMKFDPPIRKGEPTTQVEHVAALILKIVVEAAGA